MSHRRYAGTMRGVPASLADRTIVGVNDEHEVETLNQCRALKTAVFAAGCGNRDPDDPGGEAGSN